VYVKAADPLLLVMFALAGVGPVSLVADAPPSVATVRLLLGVTLVARTLAPR